MFKVSIKILLFDLLILSYCITSSDTGSGSSSLFKYAALLLCVVYSYFDYRRRHRRYMYSKYKQLIIFVAVVILYSLIKSLLAEHFSFRTVQELIFLAMPMLYGYFVVNTWRRKDVDNAFKTGVIISFICYLASLGMSFDRIVTAFFESSFGDSFSELESFTFCGLALAFCLYFCYYNKSKLYMFLSILFVFMTFKRLFIIIAIALLILAQFKIREHRVSKKVVNITIMCLFAFAILYFVIMQPSVVKMIEARFDLDVSELTSTRSDRMRWLVNSNFVSYGFGSSTEYMYNKFNGALEMDASKIILELGYIPLFLFIRAYLKFASSNLYVFLFMVFMLLNLTVSSGLTGAFAWIIIFISISMISIYPENTWKRKRLLKKKKEVKY